MVSIHNCLSRCKTLAVMCTRECDECEFNIFGNWRFASCGCGWRGEVTMQEASSRESHLIQSSYLSTQIHCIGIGKKSCSHWLTSRNSILSKWEDGTNEHQLMLCLDLRVITSHSLVCENDKLIKCLPI